MIFMILCSIHRFLQMDRFWDGRVRSYLGTRYDAGKNVFDMDFSMKLKERATLLDSREYATWRQTGDIKSQLTKCE